MAAEASIGLGALALVLGFPLFLLGGLWLLGWLEAWMVQPDERAATVRRLLDEIEEDADLEAAVAALLSEVADPPMAPSHAPAAPEPARIRSQARSMLAG